MSSREQASFDQGVAALQAAGVRDVTGAGLAHLAAEALTVAAGIGTDAHNPYGLDESIENMVAAISDRQAVALAGASATVWQWRVKGVSARNSDAQNARARLEHLLRKVIRADWRELAAREAPLSDP